MKDFIKSNYYKFQKKGQLNSYDIKLGYVFHTEKLYDNKIYDKLLLFCKEYKKITGAKPICTIIPPTNLLQRKEMEANDFSEKQFVLRVVELSKFSIIGYHGHFYLNN